MSPYSNDKIFSLYSNEYIDELAVGEKYYSDLYPVITLSPETKIVSEISHNSRTYKTKYRYYVIG